MSGHSKADALDEFLPVYFDLTPDRIVDRKSMEFILEFVLPRIRGNRVLELGAGDQIWAPKLVERFHDVTTIEGSAELLKALERRLGPKTNWRGIVALFEDYRPAKPYDVVIATYVLEHVDDPEQILRIAHDYWLKSNGQIAIVVPHSLSLHRRLAVAMGLQQYPGELGETDRRVGHKRCLSFCEMEHLLWRTGFKVVEKRGFWTKVLPNAMLTHCTDEQLRGMFRLGMELPIEYAGIIYYLSERRNETRGANEE
jgi:trans-aconitate methyltransferase